MSEKWKAQIAHFFDFSHKLGQEGCNMIDKNMERRVWQRIYPQPPRELPKWRRDRLQQCLQREQQNFRYYDDLRMDEMYGPAFGRLADDAIEHIKMLQQILRR